MAAASTAQVRAMHAPVARPADARRACAARSSRSAISTASTSATRRWSGEAVQRGAHERRPAIVATFDPHPVRHFGPHAAVPADHARPARADCSPRPARTRCWCSTSTPRSRRPRAEDFVAELLAGHIGAAGVVTGEDFTFGKGRGGNVAVLRELGARHGIAAATVGPVLLDGERGLLEPHPRRAQGRRLRDRDAADDPPVRDRGRGRSTATSAAATLGYPTANLELGTYLRPRYGIYAVPRAARRGSEHEGRRQPRHPPDLRPAEGAARSLFSSTSTATSTGGDRGRAAPLSPARGEVRQPRRAEGADGRGCRGGAAAAR